MSTPLKLSDVMRHLDCGEEQVYLYPQSGSFGRYRPDDLVDPGRQEFLDRECIYLPRLSVQVVMQQFCRQSGNEELVWMATIGPRTKPYLSAAIKRLGLQNVFDDYLHRTMKEYSLRWLSENAIAYTDDTNC